MIMLMLYLFFFERVYVYIDVGFYIVLIYFVNFINYVRGFIFINRL